MPVRSGASDNLTGIDGKGYAPELKEQAKSLYFSHAGKADISRATGVNVKTLSKWIAAENWAVEREDADRSLIEDAFGARRITVATLARTTAEQLVRAVNYIIQRPEPPSLQEAEKLAAILGQLDKVTRLDEGKATENIAVSAQIKMTAEQVRKVIAEDPFFSPPVEEATS